MSLNGSKTAIFICGHALKFLKHDKLDKWGSSLCNWLFESLSLQSTQIIQAVTVRKHGWTMKKEPRRLC